MKLITVIGARPQFIKSAPFSELFRKDNIELYIHTGQHYDSNMSDIFFEELNIPRPDYHLDVGSASHGQQTALMLSEIEKILLKEKPDAVLVYGDTNSTLAGALAASKIHIPVYHIEAGLRSFNKYMPEEQNRILTDHLSTFLFCPTDTAVNNLNREGINSGVYFTGDIMFDAVLNNIQLAENKYRNDNWRKKVFKNSNYKILEKGYYLATIHRAENTDNIEKIKVIFETLNKLNKPVLLPIHPRTKKIIENMILNLSNIIIIEPVGYLLMLYLTKNAYMVITDSGGLQKESFFLEVPCTTLRNQTEWIETLDGGWNVLSRIEEKEILKNAYRSVENLIFPKDNKFGNGNSAQRILDIILHKGDL